MRKKAIVLMREVAEMHGGGVLDLILNEIEHHKALWAELDEAHGHKSVTIDLQKRHSSTRTRVMCSFGTGFSSSLAAARELQQGDPKQAAELVAEHAEEQGAFTVDFKLRLCAASSVGGSLKGNLELRHWACRKVW
jgi:hypothetical protein